MKEVMRFVKKTKLSPQYIGIYEILRCSEDVTYELDHPAELFTVHIVFHLSMLKKCIRDPSLVVHVESIGVKDGQV